MKQSFFKISLLNLGLIFTSCSHFNGDDSNTKTFHIGLSSKGNDIAFAQDTLQVPFGKRIRLIFKNEAEVDSEISHNVAIIKPGKEAEVDKVLSFEDYDYTDDVDFFKGRDDLLLGNSAIIQPQAEGVVEFRPPKPGFYTYICLMPGHGNIMKMKGKLLVRRKSVGEFSSDEIQELKDEYVRESDIPFPEDNPLSPEKQALGKKLFFDKRLSRNSRISCASCHIPRKSFEDGLDFSRGVPGVKLTRHTPTVINLAWGELFFWDGRSASLEEQALGPIQSKAEMNLGLDEMVEKLKKDRQYVRQFNKVFPRKGVSSDSVAKALATYQRTLVSEPSPFDRWVSGEEEAISNDAKRGFVIFNEKANCAACHSSWRFTDDSFHDIGLKTNDRGRGKLLPKIQKMQFAFKTPTLRNAADRSPFMHTGKIKTIRDVLEFYNRGGDVKRRSLAADIRPLNLNERELQQLEEFLKTLSSNIKF